MGHKLQKLNSTNVYIAAWVVAQLNVLLASSEIAYTALGTSSIRYTMYVIAAIFLSTKMIIFDKYKSKILLMIVAAMITIGLVSYHALGLTLILHGIFLVSLKAVYMKKLIKADMMLRIIVTAVLFLLAVIGIINNYSDVINGNLKYAFGWLHPNTFAYQIIAIIIEAIYISKKKVRIREILAIIAVLIALWIVCASRTTIYAFILFLIIYLMVDNGILINRKFFSFLLGSIIPICGIVSWLLVWLFSQGNSFAIKMNSILTSRLVYSVRFLGLYPINLWGNEIYTVSTREHYLLGVRSEILDMSYIRLLLEYGTVFFTMFLILYIVMQVTMVKNNRFREAAIVVYFSILGITSTGLLSPFSNFSLLFITFLMETQKVQTTRKQRTMNIPERHNV